MATHFEQSLQRDIDRIRSKVAEMCGLAEKALRDGMKALAERNRVLAYSVILRDQHIDELEKELDRLCLEFLVRQQPVAMPLRFAYASIRINLELERVGDYAEGIARQVLKLTAMDTRVPVERFAEIANLSVPMLHDSVKAFVEQDAELAHRTAETEEVVDELKRKLNGDLMRLNQESPLPLESLNALMMIARHFERVSDQARNICTEVMYMCTGEYNRHRGNEATRVLFVDVHNSSLSQMAEAVGNSLDQSQFIFASAGLEPTSLDPGTIGFLKARGLEVAHASSKGLNQILNLDHYHIMVALEPEARKAFPKVPTKTVCLDWSVPDPAPADEATYDFLRSHIEDLVKAVLDGRSDATKDQASKQSASD